MVVIVEVARLGRVLRRPRVRISQIMTSGRARIGWILRIVAVARSVVPMKYRCWISVSVARARMG